MALRRIVLASLLVLQGVVLQGVGWRAQAEGPAATDTAVGQYRGARPTEYPSWFKQSFLELDADVADARAAGRRVLLLFHQDGCPYCNALVERSLSQKDIEEYAREHLDVIAINIWGDRDVLTVEGKRFTEKELAAALKVQFTPTLLFLDESGQTVLRLNGFLPPDEFRQALIYVVEKREGDGSYRDYLAANSPPSSSGGLNAQPFFEAEPFDLRGSTRPVAVFFEQRQCPNCDILHQRVLSDPETRNSLQAFRNFQLDMWSSTPVITPSGERITARDWARRLGVKYAPTIVVLDATGTEIIRSEAFFKRFHTRGILDYVSGGGYQDQPSFQRWLSARAEQLREQGQDVDIWE